LVEPQRVQIHSAVMLAILSEVTWS
jgi:hypothetical protein